MLQFDRLKTKELVKYLYYSNIHDAKIEKINYNKKCKDLIIKTINPIFNVEINFYFKDIKYIYSEKSLLNCGDTILSLTIENDFSYFQDNLNSCLDGLNNSLYLLFQTFSGNELHIVSEKVLIEDNQGSAGKTGDGSLSSEELS